MEMILSIFFSIIILVILGALIAYSVRATKELDATGPNGFVNGPVKMSVSECETQTQSKQENNMEQEQQQSARPVSMEIAIESLKKLRCQPQIVSDKDLLVMYQGETFEMHFSGMLVRIWDPAWLKIDARDPNLRILREATDETNLSFGPSVVFSKPNNDGTIIIHSLYDTWLHPACPYTTEYLEDMLGVFFDLKQELNKNFLRLESQSQQPARSRRPVGFSADEEAGEAAATTSETAEQEETTASSLD